MRGRNPGEVTAELRCRERRLVFASDTRHFPESPSDCASGARCAATNEGEEEEGEEEGEGGGGGGGGAPEAAVQF